MKSYLHATDTGNTGAVTVTTTAFTPEVRRTPRVDFQILINVAAGTTTTTIQGSMDGGTTWSDLKAGAADATEILDVVAWPKMRASIAYTSVASDDEVSIYVTEF